MAQSQWILREQSYQRPLGASEIAYYYPSLQNGLGDMFLHIAFRATKEIMTIERLVRAWAAIRSKHPLLMSKVISLDEAVPTFSFTPKISIEECLKEAKEALYVKNDPKDKLISDYMDGPRTLSSEQLSYLVISTQEHNTQPGDGEGEYELLMCAPHFLGDGASLHQCTHDLLSLLSSHLSNSELELELLKPQNWIEHLPPALETRLLLPGNRLAKAASDINLIKTLRKEVGGHTLSRSQRGPQRTRFVQISFTEAETAAILASCKAHNVTVNHALFVLCNIAWSRYSSSKHELPLMMYTAINLRPFLQSHPSSTYWFVALSYYNVVLPAFLPAKPSAFWLRAQSVKAQTRRIVQSPFLPARAVTMAKVRCARAQGKSMSLPHLKEEKEEASPAPSACLLGLSLIGNLDGIYTRSSYPCIQLHDVTTASRQKAGGLLLLEHTFAKKLWIQLFYDEMGFQEGQVEHFWRNLENAVLEFLNPI